jgi:signal transduction histidine kinase
MNSGQICLSEEEIDVIALVDRVVRVMLPEAAKAGVRLDFRIEPNLPRLRAGPQRLQQVLINLLSNAIKFTATGGNVLVMAEARETGMTISVKDTGIGIEPENLARVFERFWQADNGLSRRYGGTGLGLPIACDLVELHGGRLALESRPGVGTTATIFLPADRLVSNSAGTASIVRTSSSGSSVSAHVA